MADKRSTSGHRTASLATRLVEPPNVTDGVALNTALERVRMLRTVTKAPSATSPCKAVAFNPCSGPSHRDGPEYTVRFREGIPLVPILTIESRFEIACTPIVRGQLDLGLDFGYVQDWCLQKLALSDLAACMSLAPSERLTLTIKKTQRTRLDHKTLESSESLESLESSRVDKEVLAVTRSTTRTKQWRIDGTGSISMAKGALGATVSAGFTSSVESTSRHATERISESTSKSASQLKLLQKIEVGRTTESVFTTQQTRTVVNPYHDRSLTLNVFELSKHYVVTTRLAELRPILRLMVEQLQFDEEFVTENSGFLTETLIDRSLSEELRAALDEFRAQPVITTAKQARAYARLAFDLLFQRDDIFNFGPGDRSNPARSFDARLGEQSGYDDGWRNNLGRLFTTLNFFYSLHSDLPDDDRDAEINLAVALADSIKEKWQTAGDGEIRNVLDRNDATEVFRRISGFLSLVDQVIRPLLRPKDEERAARESANRLAFVLDRVVGHLSCHRSYYVEAYLRHVAEVSSGLSLADAVQNIFESLPEDTRMGLLVLFDLDAVFLDGPQIIIPARDEVDLAAAIGMLGPLVGGPNEPQPEALVRSIDVVVPADGVHIEPVAGQCLLADVPDPVIGGDAELRLRVGDGALPGLESP